MSETAELFDLGPGPRVFVARVLVDVDLPHLDHLLDYVVPDSMREQVRPGVIVKVPLSGRMYQGWVIECVDLDSSQRVLHPLSAVVSTVPVLDRATYERARSIAERHAATTSQVLSLVIPQRHAGAEKKRRHYSFVWDTVDLSASTDRNDGKYEVSDLPHGLAKREETSLSLASLWSAYEGGSAFVADVQAGHTPRMVWTALPGFRDEQLISALQVSYARAQQSIVIFPTQTQASAFHDALSAHSADARVALYHSDLAPSDRYGVYLDMLAGQVDIVIGTRSAAWLPAPRLGLLVVWDDGDDRLREHRAPRVDALDVSVARAHSQPCAFIAGAWSRSVKAQALVASGWAGALVASRDFRRSHMPRISVPDVYDFEREGPSASAQIPASVQQKIRRALEDGPVLVHVPAGGYVPRIACQECRSLARCSHCHGQLSVTSDERIRCLWCDRDLHSWVCSQCRSTRVRALRIGSARTGEMLGKAFPGFPLVQSRAGHLVTETLNRQPRLVVATPGAEPSVEGGYELAVVLDPHAIAERPELWAPEEALRRWMNVFALLAPHGHGIVAGMIDPLIGQSLIRWDPSYLTERLLSERIELGFFPAATIVALEGPTADVRRIALELGREVLASIPLKVPPTSPQGARQHISATPADTEHYSRPESLWEREATSTDERVRTLIRTSRADSAQLLSALKAIQQSRSAHKEALVKVTVNPPELFQ